MREALILQLQSGAEYKAYKSGVIAVVLVVLVPLYAKLVDAVPRIKLVIGVTLAFAAQLLLFLGAMAVADLRQHIGLVFYAWVGVFNMMIVAQFWAYANDLCDKERGARLFPMIALGASIGAAGGAQISAFLIPLVDIPTMLLRLGVLFAGVALIIALLSYELGTASTFGWLLALPVSLAAYKLISGTWGVCAYHGVKGSRDTDHGQEVVLDRESRSRMRLRALLAVSASIVVGLAFAAAFVASA